MHVNVNNGGGEYLNRVGACPSASTTVALFVGPCVFSK